VNKAAQIQVAYLEALRKNNLLELELSGRLPKHIRRAALVVAIADNPGVVMNEDKTAVVCTAEEHEEAEKEKAEYIKHYRLTYLLTRPTTPKRAELKIGGHYAIKSGYYADKVFAYLGTDKGVWGISWNKNIGNPACENFLFRAERDNLPMTGGFHVMAKDGKHYVFHDSEIGEEAP
jgi:hypothetical protein